jgi:hypothetical protein
MEMKKVGLILLILTCIVFLGCTEKKDIVNTKATSEQKDSSTNNKSNTTNKQLADLNTQAKIMDNFKVFLDKDSKENEVIQWIDKNIAYVSPDNASVIVEGFETIQKKNLPKLQEKYTNAKGIQQKMIKIYKPEFGKSKIDEVSDKELKDLLIYTYDSGYKIEISEGCILPVIDYSFYKKYSTYLTPDIKSYIELMIIECEKKPIEDGGLKITWDEVVKRAIDQQKFISTYTNSTKTKDIKQLLQNYLYYTMFGADNTPIFTRDTKKMMPEAKTAYLKVMDTGENSTYLIVLIKYMELLKRDNYKLTDDVDKFRKDAINSTKF